MSGRHRVVYLDHVARLSGGEIALVRLLDAARDVVDAHVILGEDGPLVQRLRDAGASVEVLPMAESVRDACKGDMTMTRAPWRSAVALTRYVWAVRCRLRELRPDLVHTNSLKAAVYGGIAGRLAGIPVIWHVRDRISPDYLPRRAVTAIRLMSRVLPTRIAATSITTMSTLPLTRRCEVLVHAVGPDKSRPAQDHVDGVAPPRDSVPFTVGMVGRIAPWKGQDVLLRAFASAFAGGPERLHLIGSAMFGEHEFEREIRSLATDLGLDQQMTWLGFQDDVTTELARLDVLVHCSITAEPFGQVVVEGMLAGLAVIAAADGGPVEIIDNGRDGVLVRPGDVEALTGALRRLADDPQLRHRMGTAAAKSARRFDPRVAAAGLDALYTGVTSQSRQ